MKAVLVVLVLLAVAISGGQSQFGGGQGGFGGGQGGFGGGQGGFGGGQGGFGGGQSGFGGGQGGFGGGQGGFGGPEGFGPNRDYLPPTQSGGAQSHSFDSDGYRYRNPSQF